MSTYADAGAGGDLRAVRQHRPSRDRGQRRERRRRARRRARRARACAARDTIRRRANACTVKPTIMIDFDLSEEQRLLEQSVREWARARGRAPSTTSIASTGSIATASSADGVARACSASRCRRNTAAPAWTTSASGLASEELEYVDTSLRVIMSVHAGLNCLTLLAWGTEDQKQRYLVPQAQGKKIASYGLTEPGAGSDVRGIQTVAVKKGRSLRADRREDVDLAGRRRRQLPRVRLDRSREEEAARHRPASAPSSSSARSRGFRAAR